jgi:hypothetical protein
MANTASYPIIAPKAGDLLVGTQTFTVADPVTDNPTRNFTVQSIADLAPLLQLGYTSYTASFTQTQTTDPVIVEIYNNTGATFTWTRVSVGEYDIVASSEAGVLSRANTFLNIQGSAYTSPPEDDTIIVQPQGFFVVSNTIRYRSMKTSDGSLSDNNAGWLEIRIYN